MTTDEQFDIAEAAYVYLVQNHGGQGSYSYELLSQLLETFNPSASTQKFKLGDEALAIFNTFRDWHDVCAALCKAGLLIISSGGEDT